MIVRDLSNLSKKNFSILEAELGNLNTLAEVLIWTSERSQDRFAPRIVSSVIVQDEYTHDVIIPFNDAFLVFDTT